MHHIRSSLWLQILFTPALSYSWLILCSYYWNYLIHQFWHCYCDFPIFVLLCVLIEFDQCSHEMVGEVAEVGSKVRSFKVGDKAGVGVMTGSCGSCDLCTNGSENYCPKFMFTYNSTHYDGTQNYGGYSDIIVVNEHLCTECPITCLLLLVLLCFVPGSQQTVPWDTLD